MAEQEEARFKIDGHEYDIPAIDSFTMDEAQVLWDYAGLSLGDFAVDDEDPDSEQLRQAVQDKIRNPGFMRTLMHVAYQRGNPKIPAGRVKALIGQSNLVEAMAAMAELAGEDDAGPPEQSRSSEPETSSGASSSSSNNDSGSASPAVSDEPEQSQTPTGIHRLPSSISDAKTSVA
jgi:hypothetical protein